MDKEFLDRFGTPSAPVEAPRDEALDKSVEEAVAVLKDPETSGFVLICLNVDGKAIQRHYAGVSGLLVAAKMADALATAKLFHPKE